MKTGIWCLAVLVLFTALGQNPFRSTDVAELQPVEVVLVSLEDGRVQVRTDTGGLGTGPDPASAMEDLQITTPGRVFLDTAEHLLVSSEMEDRIEELLEFFRPGCSLCLTRGEPDLEQAAAFLRAHEPELTLMDYRAGLRDLPVLNTKEGRMELEPG